MSKTPKVNLKPLEKKIEAFEKSLKVLKEEYKSHRHASKWHSPGEVKE